MAALPDDDPQEQSGAVKTWSDRGGLADKDFAAFTTAETAEAEPGSINGQRAVEAIVTHRAERTAVAIVAEVSVVTFMVVAPASKQVHGAVPR